MMPASLKDLTTQLFFMSLTTRKSTTLMFLNHFIAVCRIYVFGGGQA